MGPPSSSQQGAVVMVYGLNMAKLNCERLFNLFCLYGNVVRVSYSNCPQFSHLMCFIVGWIGLLKFVIFSFVEQMHTAVIYAKGLKSWVPNFWLVISV